MPNNAATNSTSAPPQPNQAPPERDNTQLPPGGNLPQNGGPWLGPSNDKKADALWNRLRRRFFTQAGNGVAIPVTSTHTTLTITLPRVEQDANYGVNVTPDWLTTVKVTAKSTTQFTVTFGTAAPAGATLDYITFRAET